MANMDKFNKATAVILNMLYESFPLRIPLRNHTFDSATDEDDLLIYRDTIMFLEKEGFIRYDGWSSGTQVYFESVALTSKGLANLNSTPAALKEKTTVAQKLRGALAAGSGEAIKAAVEAVISIAASRAPG